MNKYVVYGLRKNGVEYAVASEDRAAAYALMPKLPEKQRHRNSFAVTNYFDMLYEEVFDLPDVLHVRRLNTGVWLHAVPTPVADSEYDASPCDVEKVQ